MTRETLLERFASPFHRTLRAHEKLRGIYPDTRRARLTAQACALRSDHPLSWQQCAAMLAAEEKASK